MNDNIKVKAPAKQLKAKQPKPKATKKKIPKPKIVKDWTKEHERKLVWLFNYMYPRYTNDNGSYLDKSDFIIKNKRSIIEIINKNEKWALGSKEGLLFMVARYLLINGYIKDSKRYSEWGHELTEQIADITELNALDEKEMINYREQSYFKAILKNIDGDKIENFKEHQQHLLLNMLVLQPPVRTSFYTSARFSTKEDPNDKINNYIQFNRRGKTKAFYIINKDKVTNTKVYAKNKNLSKIELINDQLAQMLYDSYIKYPRKYLFENNKKKITDNTILEWLRVITNVDKINIDIMRSSYITYFYKNNKTYKARNDLSKQMRHSITTAQKNYNKVLEIEQKPSNEQLDIKQDQINQLQIQLHECKDKKEQQKADKKEQQQDDKADKSNLTKKNKYDTLYNLNVRKLKPRESTLKKYDITFNNATNLYI